MRIHFADCKISDPSHYSRKFWAKALRTLARECNSSAAEEWFYDNYKIKLLREAKFGSDGISGVEIPEETLTILLLKIGEVDSFTNDALSGGV